MMTEAQPDHIHSKATPHLIAKLLLERQEVLVLLQRLVEMKSYNPVVPVQPILQQFCQVLVDYVALGHFEVYQCFENNTKDSEQCRRVKRLAREQYSRIANTTQAALDFNDRYDRKTHSQPLDTLYADLSKLGEQVATRIALEDRLIAAMQSPVLDSVQ
jgi:regulator of sigma D